MSGVTGLMRGGQYRVFNTNGEVSEEEFLGKTTVGTAFVISGDDAKEVEVVTKRFQQIAKRRRITLRWDEAEVLRSRERVVLTGLAPNELTRLVVKHRQHGLVRALAVEWYGRPLRPYESMPEAVVDPSSGVADGLTEVPPRQLAAGG